MSCNDERFKECEEIVDYRLNHAARLSDIRWSSYFHVNSRRVDRLRQGRVFVAGDVAHIYSPAAPQDMNTGIQETVNLAWKIALVLRGEAEDRLLDTYDEERRPIEGRVLTTADVVTNILAARHGPLSFLRDHAAAHVFGRPPEGGLRSGERAADAWVKDLAALPALERAMSPVRASRTD